MSQDYRSDFTNRDPPPGQGHYNQYPPSGYDDEFDRAPRPQPHAEPGYVPYQDSYESVNRASRDDRGYGAPRGSSQYDERPYAPSDPTPHEFNQISPYDQSKADAGWAGYMHGSRRYGRGYNDYDDRYNDRYDRDYDDRDYDDRDYDSRRRRRSDDDVKEKILRYPSDPKKGGRDVLGASEGDRERGFGAQLLGSAGGAILGKKFGGSGALGTIGGAVIGAIAAHAAEKQYEKRKGEKVYKKRESEPYAVPAGPYPGPGRSMDDVRDSGREGRDVRGGIRERLRSLSRSARDRVRSRSRSRRRRRSDSMESDERYHYR